jgi:hypothetical protein
MLSSTLFHSTTLSATILSDFLSLRLSQLYFSYCVSLYHLSHCQLYLFLTPHLISLTVTFSTVSLGVRTQALALLVKAGGPLDTTDNDGRSVLSLAYQNKNLHAAVAAGQAMRMPGMLQPQVRFHTAFGCFE